GSAASTLWVRSRIRRTARSGDGGWSGRGRSWRRGSIRSPGCSIPSYARSAGGSAPRIRTVSLKMWIVLLYLGSIVVANLITAAYGPVGSVLTSLALIGGVLTLRDRLHDRWAGR